MNHATTVTKSMEMAVRNALWIRAETVKSMRVNDVMMEMIVTTIFVTIVALEPFAAALMLWLTTITRHQVIIRSS
jgi:flagellar motor switch protein FliM